MKTIPYIFIIALICYIVFLRECTSPQPIIETKIVTQHDSIYVPIIDTFNTLQIDTVWLDSLIYNTIIHEQIDTIYILRDYFTKYYYTDTIRNDSQALIVINDTLYRNRIKSRYSQIKLFAEKPTLKNNFYIGGGITGGQDRLGLTVNGAMITKRKKLYTASYDLINKEVSLSLYIKIF